MDDAKILAVDDSPTMRRIITNTLKRAGYSNITEACNGKDALAKMKVDCPNLVVTDWNMPEMDGLTFVAALRSDEDFKNVPVLMITSRSVREDIVEAMRVGVNNYIVKPFTPDVLKDKIEQLLQA